MYFSSLFPYVVLICFLIRALLLNGSIDGIRHMFTPKVCTAFLFKAYDHKSIMFIVQLFPQLDLKDNCPNICMLAFLNYSCYVNQLRKARAFKYP